MKKISKALLNLILGDLKSTKDIYGRLNFISVTFTIVIFELCVQCNINLTDLLVRIGINTNTILGVIITTVLVNMLGVIVLYYIFNALFTKITQLLWGKLNPDKFIDGKWLHIHDKETVPIGIVEIKQDFFDLSVNGVNFRTSDASGPKTTWNYEGAAFNPGPHIKLIGCYTANRANNGAKHGVHLFTDFDIKDNKVVKMSGDFGDSLKTEDGVTISDLRDRTGKITFYRLSKKMVQYLGFSDLENFESEKLINILDETSEEILQEDFVSDLRKIYYKNDVQSEWKKIKSNLSPDETRHLEDTLAIVDTYIAYADGEIDKREIDYINCILGFKWTARHIYDIRQKKLEDIKIIISNTISTLRQSNNNFTVESYKKILKKSCKSVALCNEEYTTREREILDFVNNI